MTPSWEADNREDLARALGRVREMLAPRDGEARLDETPDPTWRHDRAPAIQSLVRAFSLSPFERDTVLLCAGMELDGSFGALCARAAGDPNSPFPTLQLALARLHDSHWDALAPAAPLRAWGLVDVEPGPILTLARLRVPPRIWQFLIGVETVDERILRHATALHDAPVSPSQEAIARQIAVAVETPGAPPLIQICGRGQPALLAVAAAAVKLLAVDSVRFTADSLPSAPDELDTFARVLGREALLRPLVVVVDAYDLDAADSVRHSALRLLGRYGGLTIVLSRERRAWGPNAMLSFDVAPPTEREQRERWRATTGDDRFAATLSGQFDLDFEAINAAALAARAELGVAAPPDGAATLHALWDGCRSQARPQLEDLAQRLDTGTATDALVLPAAQADVLHDIEVFVKHRAVVDGWWGVDDRTARGRGTAVLFAGPSGTGKTLAAEVLANRLRLDLYRIDISAIVSKYIGETEKNLRRLFDHAEYGGAVLLFDEADALFGKRGEVKDSHDRHANVAIGYLLQRVEAFRGLTILTTNLKGNIDHAFMRRLRFVVDFPFPDQKQRAEIWERAFPHGAPVARLDYALLSRLNVSGASIRNMALHASYLAADEAEPAIGMRHLRAAARREFEKLQQPLPAQVIREWE